MKYAVTAVSLIIFLVFMRTSPPTIYMGDGGEIVAAAYTLGIGHPPGYPLYMLAAKIFSFIPLGDIAFRLNLFSAFLAAFVFVLMTLASREFIIFAGKGAAENKGPGPAALAAASLFIFSGVFWFQAIQAKGGIYVFAAVIILASILSALKYFNTKNMRFMFLAVYSAGLMIPAHPSTALFALFLLACVACRSAAAGLKRGRAAASAIFFLAALLTPYLYLFIRVGSAPLVNWAGLSSAGDVIGHIMRKTYADQAGAALPGAFLFRFFNYMLELLKNYNVWLIMFLYGMILLYRSGKAVFYAAVFFVIINTAALLYAADTQAGFSKIAGLNMSLYLSRGFFLINDIVPVLVAALGFYGIFRAAAARSAAACNVVVPLMLLAPFALMTANFAGNDHSMDFLAYDHAMNIMKTLNKNDKLFSHGDCPSFNIAYLKNVKKLYAGFDVYGRDMALLDISIYRNIPGTRQAVEAMTLRDNPGRVFYTDKIEDKDRGILSTQYGIVYKAVKGAPEPDSSEKYFMLYTIRDYFRDRNLDVFYRDYIAKYFTGRAACAAMRNDILQSRKYLSLADKIGGDSAVTLIDIINICYSGLNDHKAEIFFLKKLCVLNPRDMETLDVLMNLYVNYNNREAYEWIKGHYYRLPDGSWKAGIKAQIEALGRDVGGL